MKTSLKSFILLLAITAFYQSAHAQTGGGFGIKGGLNYNSNGEYFKDAEAVWGDPRDNMGFHLGMFGKVNAGPIFFRPEVNYTKLTSEINYVKLTTQRLDAPLLVGVNLIGSFLSVFAGPSLHYYLEDELRNFDFDEFNAGYQAGIGLNFGNLGLDFRYERILNKQTVSINDVFTGDGNFRFQQLMLGLSLKF